MKRINLNYAMRDFAIVKTVDLLNKFGKKDGLRAYECFDEIVIENLKGTKATIYINEYLYNYVRTFKFFGKDVILISGIFKMLRQAKKVFSKAGEI